MKHILILGLSVILAMVSCKSSEKEIDTLSMAREYYAFLDSSEGSKMAALLGDRIVIRESQDNYEEDFSRKEYLEWLEWDSVFEPTYKVLEIERNNGSVRARISKLDKRIFFLQGEPMVWNEIIRFDNEKIARVERIEYEVFNVEKFLKNRDGLVNWIAENHPELNGFLYDQTAAGGMAYLKAIELYKKRE